jgi:hypothetical protein
VLACTAVTSGNGNHVIPERKLTEEPRVLIYRSGHSDEYTEARNCWDLKLDDILDMCNLDCTLQPSQTDPDLRVRY